MSKRAEDFEFKWSFSGQLKVPKRLILSLSEVVRLMRFLCVLLL